MAVLLLGLSIFFVLAGQVVMIMGVLFSLLSLFGDKLRFKSSKNLKKKVFLTVYAFAMIFELSAIATGYAENEFGGGTLFHPDPKMDILISQLYWIPFSLFWTYLFTKYTYSRRGLVGNKKHRNPLGFGAFLLYCAHKNNKYYVKKTTSRTFPGTTQNRRCTTQSSWRAY